MLSGRESLEPETKGAVAPRASVGGSAQRIGSGGVGRIAIVIARTELSRHTYPLGCGERKGNGPGNAHRHRGTG